MDVLLDAATNLIDKLGGPYLTDATTDGYARGITPVDLETHYYDQPEQLVGSSTNESPDMLPRGASPHDVGGLAL